MKIFYDSQIFSAQKYGGISRYFTELIKGINNYPDMEAILPPMLSVNNYLNNDNKLSLLLEKYNFRGKYRLLKFINRQISKYFLTHNKFDIFHPTYYDPYYLKMGIKTPIVVTVYDMIHELFPQFFRKDKTTIYKEMVVNRADKIIALSQNTKNDLCNIFNINPDKISVIYHTTFFQNIEVKPLKNIPNEYLLFVGSRAGYKNFNFILKSISHILKSKRIFLICASSGKFNQKEIKLINELKIEKQVIQLDPTDPELKFLYENAIAFIFPSLYEGFGIPILEAFSCKCPVILSNSSCFLEIAKDAGIYFDPTDIDSIYFTVKEIVEGKINRNQIIEKELNILSNFSCEITVGKTVDLYKSLL